MQCGQLLVLAQLPQAVNLALLMWGRLLLLLSLLKLLLLLVNAAVCASSNRIVAPLCSGKEGCSGGQLRQAGRQAHRAERKRALPSMDQAHLVGSHVPVHALLGQPCCCSCCRANA